MAQRRKLRVGLVQHACVDERVSNLVTTAQGVREAVRGGAELVLLQELHAGPYFCQREDVAAFDRAESIPGPTTDAMAAIAKECGVVVVASVFERRAAGVYHNTAVVLEKDGSIAGRYRKMHVPDDPAYFEKFYFAPGDLGFEPIRTSVGQLGVLVCWDQWFPEAARLMALAGADLLLYPTAIGWSPGEDESERARQRDAWLTIQRSHAIANGLPVLVTNRTGFEANPTEEGEGLEFWGSSFVAGPQGEMLAEAPVGEPAVLVCEVDLAGSERIRRWWPFLRDRRIDAYGDLLRRYRD